MSASKRFRFDELAAADLIVDAIYEGGGAGTAADDPIGKLLPVGNQGGFRFKGSLRDFDVRFVALYTSGANVDWPDYLDVRTGRFVYFGDNKRPGRELHDTHGRGNTLLREAFERTHQGDGLVPPFFIFEKSGRGRDVQFRGLAVPGNPQVGTDSDSLPSGERPVTSDSRTTEPFSPCSILRS